MVEVKNVQIEKKTERNGTIGPNYGALSHCERKHLGANHKTKELSKDTINQAVSYNLTSKHIATVLFFSLILKLLINIVCFIGIYLHLRSKCVRWARIMFKNLSSE